jgi:hypothetical protein
MPDETREMVFWYNILKIDDESMFDHEISRLTGRRPGHGQNRSLVPSLCGL